MDGQPDYLTTLAEHLRSFTAERNWRMYHTPKNLAMALAGEAGELVAEFQWLTPEESERSNLPDDKREAIEAEMADVLIYLVQLADCLGSNLPEIVSKKMDYNTIRFPVESP